MNEEDKNNPQNLHTWIDPELEVRIVAMVLGEASDFEREELERIIAGNPELIAFQRRIEEVHGILGEGPRTADAADSETEWKLSSDKRSQLEALFSGKPEVKTDESSEQTSVVPVKQSKRSRKWDGILKLAAVIVVLAAFLSLMFPASRSLKSNRGLVRGGDVTEELMVDSKTANFASYGVEAGDSRRGTTWAYVDVDSNASVGTTLWDDTASDFRSKLSTESKGEATTLALQDSETSWGVQSGLNDFGEKESLIRESELAAAEPMAESRFGLTSMRSERLAEKESAEVEFARTPNFKSVDNLSVVPPNGALFEKEAKANEDSGVVANSGEISTSAAGNGGQVAVAGGYTAVERNGRDSVDLAMTDGAIAGISDKSGLSDSPVVAGKPVTTMTGPAPGASFQQLGRGGYDGERKSPVPDVAALYGDFDAGGTPQADEPSVNKPAEGNLNSFFSRPEMVVAESEPQSESESVRFRYDLAKNGLPEAPSTPEPEAPKQQADLSLLSVSEAITERDFEGDENSDGAWHIGASADFSSTELSRKPMVESQNSDGNGLPGLKNLGDLSGDGEHLNQFRGAAVETPPADRYAYSNSNGVDEMKRLEDLISPPLAGAVVEVKKRELEKLQKVEEVAKAVEEEMEEVGQVLRESGEVALQAGTEKIANPEPGSADQTVVGDKWEMKSHGNTYSLRLKEGSDVRELSEVTKKADSMQTLDYLVEDLESVESKPERLSGRVGLDSDADGFAWSERSPAEGEIRQSGQTETFTRQFPGGAENMRGFDYREVEKRKVDDLQTRLDVVDSDFINGEGGALEGAESRSLQSAGNNQLSLQYFDGAGAGIGGEAMSSQPQAGTNLDYNEEFLKAGIDVISDELAEGQPTGERDRRYAQIGHGGRSFNDGLNQSAVALDGTLTFEENNQSWFGRTSGLETVNPAEVGLKDVAVKFAAPKVEPPSNLDELTAADEAFSTFSLNVSDVSFKLAKAALDKGEWPEADKVRIEEFVNAFDYGDPLPSMEDKVACRIEQSIHPFIQQRNLVRIAMRTGAAGRAADTPLRLTFLLDNSGSMERPDRRETVHRAFGQLASQLQAGDQVTVISFARQPRLLADRIPGDKGADLMKAVREMPSEGGTNLEAALNLAFEKAREQQLANAQNRIVLLTDGAANLGNAKPEILAGRIHEMREAGIAFDAAGIVADGLNDDILEALTRKGDGRYYLLDSPDDADAGFAKQIAGALRPSAKNVKVQVEFNADRVGRYKLLGFEKHRLKKEDFRNDAVDAAELAAEETGVAVYQVETLPEGKGDIGSVSVRFRDLNSDRMIEKRWPVAYDANVPRPDQADESMRIATAASMFAAKLKGGPLGDTVDLNEVAKLLEGLPKALSESERVVELRTMIQKARELEAGGGNQ